MKTTITRVLCLAVLCFATSSNTMISKKNELNKNTELYDNSIWTELMKSLNQGKCFRFQVTSNNVKKKNRSEELGFTTYGEADLKKVSNSTIEAKNVKTYFSDRGLFRGNTTKESFRISCTPKAFTVKITQHNWGGRTVTLRDAIIFRGAYGYFIYGNYYTGDKLSFCTISLFELKCSGLI